MFVIDLHLNLYENIDKNSLEKHLSIDRSNDIDKIEIGTTKDSGYTAIYFMVYMISAGSERKLNISKAGLVYRQLLYLLKF
jgi:hypothetical protein